MKNKRIITILILIVAFVAVGVVYLAETSNKNEIQEHCVTNGAVLSCDKNILRDGDNTKYLLSSSLYTKDGLTDYGYTLQNMKTKQTIYHVDGFEDAESGGCGPSGKPRDLMWREKIKEAQIVKLDVKDLNNDGLMDIYVTISKTNCKTGERKSFANSLIAEKDGFRINMEEQQP